MTSQQIDQPAEFITPWGLIKRQALAILGAAPPRDIYCASERWASALVLPTASFQTF
jgi:hypothetical protein